MTVNRIHIQFGRKHKQLSNMNRTVSCHYKQCRAHTGQYNVFDTLDFIDYRNGRARDNESNAIIL